MAFAPIALTMPQYDKISLKNYWMKAYDQGTTTPLSMATDATGGTLLAKCELDIQGFPVTSGSARFIPFIDGDYDLWLFPTESEADANDTTNAIQLADNLNTDPIALSGLDDTSDAEKGAALIGQAIQVVSTVAVLRTIAPNTSRNIRTTGAVTANIGGHDWYAVTGAAPGTYIDNLGTIAVPDGGDGSAAWLWFGSGLVKSEWFGSGVAKTGIENAAAINAAAAVSQATINAGSYTIEGNLTLANSLSCVNGVAELNFTDTTGTLVDDTSPDGIKGLLIDGIGCTSVKYGYLFDIDNASYFKKRIDIEVKNLSNSDNTQECMGVLVFQAFGGTAINRSVEIKADVRDVVATANSVTGDTGGNSAGIHASFNATGKYHNVVISNSYVEGVLPVEDGDGIHVYHTDKSISGSGGSIIISDSVVRGCAKRQMKIQHQNTKVSNCDMDMKMSDTTSSTHGMSIYARNVEVVNCGFTGFSSGAGGDMVEMMSNFPTSDANDNVAVSSCTFDYSSKSRAFRITGTRGFTISSCTVRATGTAASEGYTEDFGHILLLDSANGNIPQGTIDGGLINAVDESSSGVVFGTPCHADVSINGLKIPASAHAIYASNVNSRPYIKIADPDFISDLATINILNASTLKVTGGSLENIASTGVVGGVKIADIQGQVTIRNTEIYGYHGILASILAAEAIIEGNAITAATSGSGVGCQVNSYAVVDNNKIKGYATGLKYIFTDRVKSANNLFVNCTVDEETTSSTNIMTNDNYSY